MVNWGIQKTLTSQKTLAGLTHAVERCGGVYTLIDVIPFDDHIRYSSPTHLPPVVYGSSTLMLGSLAHPYLRDGVFYSPHTFTMEQYLLRWGSRMLNAGGKLVALSELDSLTFSPEEPVFARPNDDTKSFSGTVCPWGELKAQLNRAVGGNPHLTGDAKILVAPVKRIQKEWRCFVVQGKVVCASRYRVEGELSVNSADVPQSLLNFCAESCQIYQPHQVFVLDVALCEESYAIIECNCFNGTGFYGHDLVNIVKAVQEYVLFR